MFYFSSISQKFNQMVKFLIAVIFITNMATDFSFAEDLKSKKTLDYVIKKVLEVDKRNRSYEARVNIYSKGFYEKGKKLSEQRETRMSGFLKFKKPLNVLFHVEESDDPMAKGSTLLYTGGEKVQIRASGLFGLIKLSFDINNPMFSNARNHKFSFDGLRNLRYGIVNANLLGTVLRNGRESYILKVVPVNKADSEITHELYFVDMETFRVLCIEMYVNNDMVSQYSIRDIKANFLKNDSEVFKL